MGFFGPPNIEELKSRRDEKGLVKALGNRDLKTKWNAALALSDFKDPRSVDEVFNTLMVVPESVDLLTDILMKDTGWRAWNAIHMLGRHQNVYHSPIAAKLVSSLIDTLVTVLKNENHQIRQIAVELMGSSKDARAVQPLISSLKDKSPNVRSTAAKWLGEMGASQAVEGLVDALKVEFEGKEHVSEPFHLEIVKALVDIGDPRAAGALVIALTKGRAEVQGMVREAFKKWGKGASVAVEPLIATLSHKNVNIRIIAVELLGVIGDLRALEPLIHISQTDKEKDIFRREVSSIAADALSQIRSANSTIK